MGHGHDHARGAHDEHRAGPERAGEKRRLALTLGLSLLILVAEVAGGLASHSLALLSDAGHVLIDVVALSLALAALFLATRPADARRTYGWYRVEILAALLNGVTLCGLSTWILWSGWRRLQAPVEVHTGLMLTVAAAGLVANLVGTWLLHDLKSLNARGAYLHLLLDTLSSVAVLIGGVVMYFAHGWYQIDPILSMVLGLLVFYNAYRLVREAADVLLEAVPRGIDLAGVTRAIDELAGVRGVHDLHIWTITSGLYALSAHIVVAPAFDGGRDELLCQVQQMLLREFRISHTTLQLEPEGHEHVGHVC
jgi:cobalt-zinc-cadmium efflux system protein